MIDRKINRRMTIMGDVTGNKGVLVITLCALAIVAFAGAFMEIGLI